jgi:hypothetical protein
VSDKRARFFAFLVMSFAKMGLICLVFRAKSLDFAALSRKRGGETPVLRLRRKPLGAPRLWPRLAGIKRRGKTAVLP